MDVGLIVAAISALLTVAYDLHMKLICESCKSVIVATVIRTFFMSLSMVILMFVNDTPQEISQISEILFPAIISAISSVISINLQLMAYQISPISSTVPYLSFQSVFAIFSTWITVGESPSNIGIIGILVVSIGAFILNQSEGRPEVAPVPNSIAYTSLGKQDEEITPLAHYPQTENSDILNQNRYIVITFCGSKMIDKGSLLIVIVSFLFAFQSAFDKLGLKKSTPLVYGFTHLSLIFTFNLITLLVSNLNYILNHNNLSFNLHNILLSDFKHLPMFNLWFNSMLWLTAYISYMISIKITFVAFCVALKRSGCLLTVIISWLFFKEKGILKKLPAIIFMTFGVLTIVLDTQISEILKL
eukprot:c13477_g1_i2.p1 GENE.c13477_g1_i2~~c13477_g1_i2.p1  ORF type:complete len:359 (+),score=107.45 c13477_g1_i2:91-1167(+)